MSIPEKYGGLGLTMAEEARIVMAQGYAAPVFRWLVGTNNDIGSQAIVLDRTGEQRNRYFLGLATGESIGSFALNEPKAGSDAAFLRTRAVRNGDDFLITGTKRFITNALRAGLFTVFARTKKGEIGAAGVSAFLVESGTEELSIVQPERKMGQKGTHTADVIFDSCRVSQN